MEDLCVLLHTRKSCLSVNDLDWANKQWFMEYGLMISGFCFLMVNNAGTEHYTEYLPIAFSARYDANKWEHSSTAQMVLILFWLAYHGHRHSCPHNYNTWWQNSWILLFSVMPKPGVHMCMCSIHALATKKVIRAVHRIKAAGFLTKHCVKRYKRHNLCHKTLL